MARVNYLILAFSRNFVSEWPKEEEIVPYLVTIDG